jgi:serine/threonine protein kinase/tetratricopeptide (TPR) repeat protein
MAADQSDDDRTQSFIALTAGTTVSHYQIIDKIGSGGMGEVYLALDTKLNRKVALKFLPPHLCQDEDCRKRFTREAQAAAGLDHPNIAGIYEVGEYQGRPFYAMQLVEGQSLREVIAGKDLPIERILEIAIQVCEGLQAAHDKGIIHRDVKPSNILLDSHGRIRIVDFGLASIRGSEQLTKTGSTLGTIGYMSPEQVQGQEIDHRSDLFSFGVVLYELITKQNPFKRESEAATLKAVSDDLPHPVARYRADVPDGLQAIIDKALEKDVKTRYQTAAGVISDINRLSKNLLSGSEERVLRPSIAVLPFTNLSADPEQEYFCDGMAEEIINALAHIEGLRVVARTSCFAFKGKHEDIREIGRKLNVDHVLEGSIRKAGNRIRITGQLIKIADGFHLWSDRFDRDLEDIFEVQDEISQAIAERLQVELLGDEKQAPARRPTENLEAYNLYLKGRYLWNRRVKSDLLKSVEYFEQAIQCDPTFALGYAGLADAHLVLADYDSPKRPERLKLAGEFSLTAIEMDESLAEPHATLASVKYYEWKWSEAEAEFKRAIELNPHYPTAHHWYGLYLIGMRRLDQAGNHFALARELDPLSPALIMAQAVYFYTARQYDQAIATCREGAELSQTPGFWVIMGWSLIEMGNHQGAIEQLNQAIELFQRQSSEGKAPPDIAVDVGRAYALMGEVEKARDILDDCLQQAETGHVQPTGIAALFISLGDNESAIEWLKRSVNDSDYWLPMYTVLPEFDSVRDDPRFVSLLSRIGLIDKPNEDLDE